MRSQVASVTAELVCFMRATEAHRDPSTRIVHDPLAARFLSPPLRAALSVRGPSIALFNTICARHRFMDDALVRALPGVSQIVLLGAGYDTRAWRFADRIGDRPVFEVDHPATAGRKARILAGADLPAVDRRVVALDFQTESLEHRLTEAGFVLGAPTFVVWEGVAMYLAEAAVRATLATVRRLGGPGSHLVMDLWRAPVVARGLGEALSSRVGVLGLRLLGEPVTFTVEPDDAPALLASEGFEVIDLADGTELGRRYVQDGRRMYRSAFVLEAARRG